MIWSQSIGRERNNVFGAVFHSFESLCRHWVLAERVRERIPGIPVLLATGYTDDLVLQNANTMQSMDIMNKPYRRIELAERIRAALAKSTGRKPNDPAYFRHEG